MQKVDIFIGVSDDGCTKAWMKKLQNTYEKGLD